MLILNGDIIDIWQFSKSYWPEAHMKVVRRILKFVTEGVPVYYLTGNHDEMLRKFTDFNLGTFQLLDKIVLNIDGKKAWIFHGDVFDVTMQHSKWLAKMGAVGYDTLIIINSITNWFLTAIGREKMSFSQKIKAKFKDAVKFINQFEQTAAEPGRRERIHLCYLRAYPPRRDPHHSIYRTNGLGTVPQQRRLGRKPYRLRIPQQRLDHI